MIRRLFRQELPPDPRTKRHFITFSGYLISVAFLAVTTLLPSVLFGGGHLILENLWDPVFLWYIVYCFAATVVLLTLLGLRQYFMYEQPVQKLSAAARQVAGGDFSVYLAPRHTSDQMDYIDTLFLDFNTMVAELGSLETLKNDFAANVSHELKTPLAVIRNYAQLLQAADLTEEQQEQVRSILQSADRLGALIFNILKLNKLEHQAIQPQPKPYNLCRQLSDCLIGFEAVWEASNIEPEADLEDNVQVCADEELMELVWNNLLSNAFKFTPPGGTVTLRQYSEEPYAVVEVIDTGCGMSAETMRHIFDKFYQGDTSHATEGNGLGLALVLRILQLVGGTIAVNSVEGKGTKFTVHVPLDSTEQKEHEVSHGTTV